METNGVYICIHTYIMEYYSAVKRNKIGSLGEMWMDLQSVKRVKQVRRRKKILYVNTYLQNLEKQ